MAETRARTRPRRTTILVTGATSGVGFAIASRLAELGHAIFVTGRNEKRGRAAVEQLRRRYGNRDIHFVRAEHASVSGNLELAATLREQVESLDVLVNNVGGIYSDRWETADGYEGTLATNFVGPVALTRELLPHLRQDGGRCVNVVSSAFGIFKGDPFSDLQSRERYVGIDAYGRAKLLNVLWTQALAEQERRISAYLVNPGMAWTPSLQRLERRAVPSWRFVWPLVRWSQRRASPEKAARAPAHVASAPELDEPSGTYFNEKGRPESLPPTATDRRSARRAWALAERLAADARTAMASGTSLVNARSR
jgi:NAD(P)-dependent dehydrogenase (short-subunit alcohol dehydrogenase family)